MTDKPQSPTITIDNKVYNVADLNDQQKELINLYQLFNKDVTEARVKLAQYELARESLAAKIVASINASAPTEVVTPEPVNEQQ